MPYNAFISYSHAADGKLAPALQHALHRIAKPWYKIRALHIFRDQTNLSVAPELWQSILGALSDSQYFILLASPEAAGSKWVQQEVDYWLTNKSKATLLIALTEGSITWDSETNDFDWNLTTALPQKLKNVFTAEPFFIDLRQQKKESQLSLSDPLFLDAAATIAATLHGVSKDQLVGEDLKQHRITKWLIRSVVTLLIGLLITAFFGFYNAKHQKDTALVEKFHVQAVAAIQNPGDMNGDPIHAHLLAAQGYQLQPDNPTAYKALLSTLLSSHTHQSLHGHTKDIHKVLYSLDGNYLVSIGDDGLILWDINQNKATQKWQDKKDTLSTAAFSPDNHQVVAGSKNGDLIFWDVASGKQLALIPDKDTSGSKNISSMITSISFSKDGKQLLTAHEGGMLKLWDANTRKSLKAWSGHQGGTNEAVFHPSDNRRAISYPVKSSDSDYHMRMWNLDNFKEIKKWQISTPSEEATNEPTAISPDGKHILSKYLRKLLFWNMDSNENLKKKLEMKNGEILLEKAGYELFAFSPDGKQFIGNEVDITNSVLTISSVSLNGALDKPTIKSEYQWKDIRDLHSLVFSPNGKQIAGGGKKGNLVIWNISAGGKLIQSWNQLNETGIDGIRDFAFSQNEMRFAGIEDSDLVKVFDFDKITEKFVLTHEIQSNDIVFYSIAISQDGKQLLLGGTDGNSPVLEKWLLSSDNQNKTFIKKLNASGSYPFKHVAFSKDNKQILAVTGEGVLVTWNNSTFEKTEIPLKGNNGNPVSLAAFSPDRKILTTTSNSHSGISMWETATGECYKGSTGDCRIQRGHEQSSISGITFNPDGKFAISSSDASLWAIWEIASGDVIARKQYDPDQEKRFERIYFRSDGKLLIFTWFDKWMLWDINPENLVEHACEAAGRPFTDEEWNRFVGDTLDYKKRACKTNKSEPSAETIQL